MNTWISKPLLLVLGLALAGCGEGLTDLTDFSLSSASRAPDDAKALSQVLLADGNIRFKSPRGWCIEPKSWRNEASKSFALVARCADLAGNRFARGAPQGYVSISIGAAQPTPVDMQGTLEAILEGDRPAALDSSPTLARARFAPQLGVRESVAWRAVTQAAGRPVLLTATAPASSPLFDGAGGGLINGIVANLEVRVLEESQPEAPEEAVTDTTPGLDVATLFGRLLNRNTSQ